MGLLLKNFNRIFIGIDAQVVFLVFSRRGLDAHHFPSEGTNKRVIHRILLGDHVRY